MMMNHGGGRDIEDPPSAALHPTGQIDILEVKKIARIKHLTIIKGIPSYHEGCPQNPVNSAYRFVIPRAHEMSLNRIEAMGHHIQRKRPQKQHLKRVEFTAGKLKRAIGVEQSRSTDACANVGCEGIIEYLD